MVIGRTWVIHLGTNLYQLNGSLLFVPDPEPLQDTTGIWGYMNSRTDLFC